MTHKGQIALSSKGLKFVDGINRKDFRFVSGSDSFVCDRLQAAFISPRIANFLSTDSTIDTFSLTHSDSRSLSFLCELLRGNLILVDDETIVFVENLLEDLGNFELNELIFEFVDEWKPLNVSNCNSRLNEKMRLGLKVTRECEFIASQFTEMKVELLESLNVCVLKDILSLDTLQITNEDWLLELIVKLGSKYFELLGSVRFEYLSCSSIDLFFENVDFVDIDSGIWHQLWIRSRHHLIYASNELSLNRFKNCFSRSPQSDSDSASASASASLFSGLIHHLCDECHGNVHERGVVNITCSSRSRNECWQVVNYDWNDYFYTTNSPKSWIQFDFKDRLVCLTHYALKSDGDFRDHLLEWTISGSNDENSWTIVDHQKTQALNGEYITKLFECVDKSSVSQFYRYFRLTQTGKNSSGSDYLQLSNIEFFGSIVKSISGGFKIEM
jgi:hypothetical protein